MRPGEPSATSSGVLHGRDMAVIVADAGDNPGVTGGGGDPLTPLLRQPDALILAKRRDRFA